MIVSSFTNFNKTKKAKNYPNFSRFSRNYTPIPMCSCYTTLIAHFNFRKASTEFDPMAEVSTMFSNNNDRDFTDFTIRSQEGKEFPCHRLILASQSPVMRAMMSNDMKEKKESKVTVKQSDEVVAHFVEYFYTKQVPQEALNGNLAGFFELAGLYELAPLKLLTEEAAIGTLSVDNMVDLFVLGDLHSAANLKTEAETFIRRNKKELKEMDLSSYPNHVVTNLLRLLI